jgi:hypothetical protein
MEQSKYRKSDAEEVQKDVHWDGSGAVCVRARNRLFGDGQCETYQRVARESGRGDIVRASEQRAALSC